MRTRSSRSYTLDEDEVAGHGLLHTIEESFYLDDAELPWGEVTGIATGVEDGFTGSDGDSIPVLSRRKQLTVKLRIPSQHATPTLVPSLGQDLSESQGINDNSKSKVTCDEPVLDGEGPCLTVILQTRPAGQVKASSVKPTARHGLEKVPDTNPYSVIEELAEERVEEQAETSVDTGTLIQDQIRPYQRLLPETVLAIQVEGITPVSDQQEVSGQLERHVEAGSTLDHADQNVCGNESICDTKTNSSEHGSGKELLVAAKEHITDEACIELLRETANQGKVESQPEEDSFKPLEGVSSASCSSTSSLDDELWATEVPVEDSSESSLPTPPPELSKLQLLTQPRRSETSQFTTRCLPREEAPVPQPQYHLQPERQTLSLTAAPFQSVKRSLLLDDTPKTEKHTRKRQRREEKENVEERGERQDEGGRRAKILSITMQEVIDATHSTGVIAAGRKSQQRRGVVPLNDHVASGRVQKPQRPNKPKRNPHSQSERSNMMERRKLSSSKRLRGGLKARLAGGTRNVR